MPCERLSQGPTTWSTWDFRGAGAWEAFRDLEDALAPVLKVSGIGIDNILYRARYCEI